MLVAGVREEVGTLSTITVYVSIGNSDDKLSQAEWSAYCAYVQGFIRRVEKGADGRLHGEWASLPYSSYQNACWCIEIPDNAVDLVKGTLTAAARTFGQDSIAWAEATTTFLRPAGDEGKTTP